MGNSYGVKYNSVEFNKFLKVLSAEKYPYALEILEDYLKNYPKDMFAYLHYAKLIYLIGDFEDFKSLLARLEDHLDKIENKKFFLYLKIREFLYEGKYQECYDYIKRNIDLYYNSENIDVEIMTFLMKKLDIIDSLAIDMPSYFLKQIVEYDEERLWSHISIYLAPNNLGTYFSGTIPFQEIYEKIKKELPNARPYRENELTFSYVFRLDGCGVIGDEVVDYIRVYTFFDSFLITTIKPFANKGRMSYVDINELKYDAIEEDAKVKTLSQVAKFKKRYNLD